MQKVVVQMKQLVQLWGLEFKNVVDDWLLVHAPNRKQTLKCKKKKEKRKKEEKKGPFNGFHSILSWFCSSSKNKRNPLYIPTKYLFVYS